VATPKRDKLERRKQAKPFPDRDKALPRSFVAAMLRRFTETHVHKDWHLATMGAAVDAAKGTPGDPAAARELEITRRQLENANRALETFRSVTGIDLLRGYHGAERLATAVNAVIAGDGHRHSLEMMKQRFEEISKQIGHAIDTWPKPAAPAAAEEPTDAQAAS